MNGIFAASGLDYQTDVFLFLVLKELMEQKLIDAEMEVVVKDQNKQKIEIDLFISKIEKSKEQKFLYEVKEGDGVLRKGELVKVFKKFHRIYDKDNNYQFVLIHSVLAKESLKELLDKPDEWVQKNVCQDRTVCCDPDNCLFPNTINNILFLPRNILGEKLSKSNKTDIELRIIDQIESILSKFHNKRSKIPQKAREIYNAMLNEIKNKTQKIAEAYRQGLSQTNILKERIRLNSLLYTRGGFVEIFMETDNYNDKEKYLAYLEKGVKILLLKNFVKCLILSYLCLKFMNKIIIKINCKKEENKYLRPFVEFYISSYFPKRKIVEINCPDKNNRQKAPDYFLIGPKVAVEIKGVYERKELEESIATAQNRERLQKALDKLIKKEKFLKNACFLDYPWHLRVKRGKEEIVARKIIKGVKQNQKDFTIEGVGQFKILGFSKERKARIILGASMGLVRSVNPVRTIYESITPKTGIANNQLEKVKANKKILLLVKRYIFGDRTSDFIEALTYSYKDLLNYKNIDEIWLQRQSRDGKFYHEILYDRDFLTSFDKEKIVPQNDRHKELFEKWFYPLQKLGDDQKEKLFISLKQFLKDEKPHQLFRDEFTREEMVRLGIWLSEKERYRDVVWLIDKFIDDPDPQEPEKYSGDSKFNYHQQIVNGEDPRIITTVLGHLAWIIQKLAVRKKYIVKALCYTKKLLSHKNLYVKLQAITPLIEIAGRRQWLKGWGKRPREGEYKEFHKTVFGLVVLVQKNPNYKAIAKWLCHIFAYYKDLSTRETEQVLNALKITEESAGLFVYFGIFRQRHYKNQSIKFNGKKLEKKLKGILQNNKEEYQRLKASIAWHLWKILDENRDEFETIRPYIDLILEQPYQRDIYDDIERIISDWIKDKPNICIQWYKQMLSKISEFIEKSKRTQIQGGLWLMHTEVIIETLARYNSNELLEVMKKLVSFWKEGVFIGSPKGLFENFKLIPNEKQRTRVKGEFQKWYNSMRKINPKIEKIDWD